MRDPFARHFASRSDLAPLCSEGPATPQHAVFGRRVPLLDTDVAGFVARYREYLSSALAPSDVAAVDPSPRIAVLADLGVCALGVDARYASIAAEVFRHDMEIMVRAQSHDRYRAAPAPLMARAELEYGGFEARERARVEGDRPLLGRIAAVTAAALQAAPHRVERLVREGCAVAIATHRELPGSKPTDAVRAFPLADDTPQAWNAFLDDLVVTFGGLDLLVCGGDEARVAERCAALLARSPVGGRVEHAGATVQAVG